MRGIQYALRDLDALTETLEAGDEGREFGLPDEEGFREGEWLLATLLVGQESFSVAGCVVDHGEGPRLTFRDRDWDRLWAFANGETRGSVPPMSQPRPTCEVQAPPGARVLLVDADVALQQVVRCLLGRAGLAVRGVTSAEEALDELRHDPVDLLLIDAALPGLSALELCRRVRRDPRLEHTPVLLLTSGATTAELQQAEHAGVNDFVPKPFRAPELGARVISLLRHRLSA